MTVVTEGMPPSPSGEGNTAEIPENLLRRWLKRARENNFAHYYAEHQLNNLHLLLGIPATVFAATVGTAVFASLENSASLWMKIGVGLISIVTAILSGLQTFLRFSEKAERHRKTAVDYGSARRTIELHLVYTNHLTYDESTKILERLDKIAEEAPNVSQRLWKRAQSKADGDYFLAKPASLLSAPMMSTWASPPQSAFPTDDLPRSRGT